MAMHWPVDGAGQRVDGVLGLLDREGMGAHPVEWVAPDSMRLRRGVSSTDMLSNLRSAL
jgi:hypothetical protein